MEKDVNKSFRIFDLIYQFILINETIQTTYYSQKKHIT